MEIKENFEKNFENLKIYIEGDINLNVERETLTATSVNVTNEDGTISYFCNIEIKDFDIDNRDIIIYQEYERPSGWSVQFDGPIYDRWEEFDEINLKGLPIKADNWEKMDPGEGDYVPCSMPEFFSDPKFQKKFLQALEEQLFKAVEIEMRELEEESYAFFRDNY